MIQPIKQKLAFMGTPVPPLYQSVAKTSNAPTTPAVSVQTQADVDKPKSFKKSLMNFFKGFNNIFHTSGGALRGVAEGLGAAAIVGVFGKNLKEHDNMFFPTIGGVLKDTGREAWKIVKNIPNAITKYTPLESITKVIKEPFKLWNEHLKGNVAVTATAILVGLGVLAFRVIQGKIHANQKNAGLDHALNEGHIPTK